MGNSYRQAGVDIDAKMNALAAIRSEVESTHGPAVIGGMGHFGGLYRFSGTGRSILVASTDSVGTKVLLAGLLDRHNTVGADLVNHCVNDILACGARPLFFLDYLGAGRVVPEQVAAIVAGAAAACRENGCALIGGETAELPGLYRPGDYDLAGTIVGTVDEERLIDGRRIAVGDHLIGLPSSGPHTNGYSLIRRVMGLTGEVEHDRALLEVYEPALAASWADALMAVHRSYLSTVGPLLDDDLIHGIAHITGGGLIDNLPRILPAGLAVRLERRRWAVPPVFRLLADRGRIALSEMDRVFNMGIGMVLISAPAAAATILTRVPEAKIIGEVIMAIKDCGPVSIEE